MRSFPELAAHERMLGRGGYVTPSNINPWRGSRRPEQVFTDNQLAAMRDEGIDPDTCDTIDVRSSATKAELWWPTTMPTPVFVLPCPVLYRRGGRVAVLSPAGMRKLVWSDGSITRRSTRRTPARGAA